MLCPECGTDNTATAKFCNECGYRFADPSGEIPVSNGGRLAAIPRIDRDNPTMPLSLDSASIASRPGRQQTPADEFRPGSSVRPSQEPSVSAEGEAPDEYAGSDPAEQPEGEPAPCDRKPAETQRFDSLADTAREMGLGFQEQQTGRIDLEGFDAADDSAASWNPDKTLEMPAIVGDAAEPSHFRAPEKPGGKKSGKTLIVVIAALALVFAGALFTLYSMGVIGGPVVPDVAGLSQQNAAKLLEEKGFRVEAKKVKSDEQEGIVLLTDPSAKSHASAGSTIVLHVATPRVVPDAVGKTIEEASGLIEAEGLKNVTITKKKTDDEEEGVVLEVSPAAGEKVTASTPVELVVAEPYRVPDIVGKSQEEAEAALSEEGLIPAYRSVYDSGKPLGTILAVEPEAGTAVKSGTAVTVQIARDRASELESIAWTALQGSIGGTVTVAGVGYRVDSIDYVGYAGSDAVNFTFTGHIETYIGGEILIGTTKQVSGTMQFDSDNSYYIL